MKDYKETNETRYDNYETQKSVKSNQYSAINPVGFYGYIKQFDLLKNVFRYVSASLNKKYEDICYLDAGCGLGGWLRMATELLGHSGNVYGFEYSQIRYQRVKNDFVRNIAWGDITIEIPRDFLGVKFDVISAADVFMHLRTKHEIYNSLKNIYNSLGDDGYFLWFDALANTHFDDSDEEYAGFSIEEMDELCGDVGFKQVKSGKMIKRISAFGKTYNTLYCVGPGLLSCLFMELVERLPVGRYTNVWRLYRKEVSRIQ